MAALLTDVETRVLGSLIEKQVTTPEYYPLTLNSLVNACNQLSNREPVVKYDEGTVMQALETLREKNLAYVFYGSESRVPKYKHVAKENLSLDDKQLAVMCVLLLRGPQTVGEIKGRTGRLYPFVSLNEVEGTLESLVEREEPAVVRLGRLPGRKESRYAHLLSGPVENAETETERPVERVIQQSAGAGNRLAELEAKVESLSAEVHELKEQLDAFRKQFE